MKLKSTRWGLVMAVMLLLTSCKKEEEEDPNAPQACFVPPAEITAGEPVMFNSSCSLNGMAYSWNFGDGGTSQDANPFHVFSEGGEFMVTLTVSDGTGGSDEYSQTVIVQTPSIIEHSGVISEDQTWIEAVHLITGDVNVRGATLTIEAGAEIRFSSGAGLYFGSGGTASGATLLAEGTSDKPITFKSAASTASPGDWDHIGFYDGASDQSVMRYCVVEYGGRIAGYGSVYLDGAQASIEHSVIRYSGGYGVALTNDAWFSTFTQNQVYENAEAPISIHGNYAHTIGVENEISGVQGILVNGDRIELAEVTWLEQSTFYFIEGDLNVGSATGSKLTISPGVQIRLGSNVGIFVGNSSNFGTLIAEGTETNRILFTSAAADGLKSPGDWDYLGFYDGAGSGSSLAYCDFEFGGGYSGSIGMIYMDGSSISVNHCSFTNSESTGLTLTNDAMFTEFMNNSFADNTTYPLEIFGNYAHTIGEGNTYADDKGILVKGDNIEQSDVTWINQGVPYVVDNDLNLGAATGSRLVIEPGTVVKFTENSALYVGNSGNFGVLVADGEPGSPIIFTSAAPAGFESPGDWDGIWFYAGTGTNTILDYCEVSYGGGYSSSSGNLHVQNGNPGVPEISNTLVSHSSSYGIYINNSSDPALTDVTYENNANGDTNK